MARLARLALPGQLHLLLLRALPAWPAFVDDADRGAWCEALRQVASAAGVAVHGYALLPGEVRLLATPQTAEGPGTLMQAIGRRYAHHLRTRHGRSGTAWEGRFRSTVVEPTPHFARCLAWAEGADAFQGLPERLAGSLGHHLGRWRDPLVVEHRLYWTLGNTPFEREAAYRRLVESAVPSALSDIADAVRRGWVLGSAAFAAEIARRSGRRTLPLPKGRPTGTPSVRRATAKGAQ